MNPQQFRYHRRWSTTSALAPALTLVLRVRAYRLLALALFPAILGLYLATLPSAYTGGRVGLFALRYLNGELVGFSVVLAVLLTLTVNIYGFRTSIRQRGATLSLGAVLASLVPSSVCCTSLVPSVLAALGASTVQIFGLAGRIQGVVARYQSVFLATATVLLLLSLHLAARTVASVCVLSRKGGWTDAANEPAQV